MIIEAQTVKSNDLDKVREMIRADVELDFGEPALLDQLESLARAAKTTPDKLVKVIEDERGRAIDLFVSKRICPECGGELLMAGVAYLDYNLVCDGCGWGQ